MAFKEKFAATYSYSDPIPYYRAYAATRLSIVEYPAALVRTARELDLAAGPVVDLGCGYGTLGALLRTGLEIEDIYAAYLEGEVLRCSPDRAYEPAITGVDQSRPALAAAQDAKFIDCGLARDLNERGTFPVALSKDSIVACCAVLGYVRPQALRSAIEQIRPRIAFVTCVTWIGAEFRGVFMESAYTITQVNTLPLFQRWATSREERQMPTALISGAHRADCYVLSRGEMPLGPFVEQVEATRARRAVSQWFAADRSDASCELAS